MKISTLTPICWYPSAGYDFKAIHYWTLAALETIKPKLFIYTDHNYRFSETLYHGPPEWKRIADLLRTFFQRSEDIGFQDDIKESLSQQLGGVKISVKEKILRGLWSHNQFETPRVLCVKINAIQLWAIHCENKEFYDYCLLNRIKIDGIMLHRHNDRFLYDEEESIIKQLNIKEGIGSPQYFQYRKEEIKEYEFMWETVYGHNNDRIAKIRYIDIFH